MKEGQKRGGQPFESHGTGVHPGVRVSCPKPTAMGKPVEDPRDAVTEAIMVVGLVTQGGQKDKHGKGEKRSGKPFSKT